MQHRRPTPVFIVMLLKYLLANEAADLAKDDRFENKIFMPLGFASSAQPTRYELEFSGATSIFTFTETSVCKRRGTSYSPT